MAKNMFDDYIRMDPKRLRTEQFKALKNGTQIINYFRNIARSLEIQHASKHSVYDMHVAGHAAADRLLLTVDNYFTYLRKPMYAGLIGNDIHSDMRDFIYSVIERATEHERKIAELISVNIREFAAAFAFEFNEVADNIEHELEKNNVDVAYDSAMELLLDIENIYKTESKNSVRYLFGKLSDKLGTVYVNKRIASNANIVNLIKFAEEYDNVIVTHGNSITKNGKGLWVIDPIDIDARTTCRTVDQLLKEIKPAKDNTVLLACCNPGGYIPEDDEYVGYARYDVISENVNVDMADTSSIINAYLEYNNRVSSIVYIIDNAISDIISLYPKLPDDTNIDIKYNDFITAISVNDSCSIDEAKSKTVTASLSRWQIYIDTVAMFLQFIKIRSKQIKNMYKIKPVKHDITYSSADVIDETWYADNIDKCYEGILSEGNEFTIYEIYKDDILQETVSIFDALAHITEHNRSVNEGSANTANNINKKFMDAMPIQLGELFGDPNNNDTVSIIGKDFIQNVIRIAPELLDVKELQAIETYEQLRKYEIDLAKEYAKTYSNNGGTPTDKNYIASFEVLNIYAQNPRSINYKQGFNFIPPELIDAGKDKIKEYIDLCIDDINKALAWCLQVFKLNCDLIGVDIAKIEELEKQGDKASIIKALKDNLDTYTNSSYNTIVKTNDHGDVIIDLKKFTGGVIYIASSVMSDIQSSTHERLKVSNMIQRTKDAKITIITHGHSEGNKWSIDPIYIGGSLVTDINSLAEILDAMREDDNDMVDIICCNKAGVTPKVKYKNMRFSQYKVIFDSAIIHDDAYDSIENMIDRIDSLILSISRANAIFIKAIKEYDNKKAIRFMKTPFKYCLMSSNSNLELKEASQNGKKIRGYAQAIDSTLTMIMRVAHAGKMQLKALKSVLDKINNILHDNYSWGRLVPMTIKYFAPDYGIGLYESVDDCIADMVVYSAFDEAIVTNSKSADSLDMSSDIMIYKR